ncbi:beta-1,4-mannosyl-glycoprotein 4-beta-N-acetylglucosaminyltransferase [Powellomyces hirtus]|uniref:Beta-1,4-mannosyl-glycoprotein 4-beta-N-acetylglucosaminyltransferase n=1 Tax=Powellomyces hirtus TaxID=109895 RepID=A0A507EE45_9FUNG|nr:beta-1,4-mannosyl-glycoprotein 4-beta-N-acetylglucosaminyltransferase [Powellomyces hirtus]
MRRRYLWVFALLFTGTFAFLYGRSTLETGAYFFRPIWDSPGKPWNILPHYYAEGLENNTAFLCSANGWKARSDTAGAAPRVFDAIIFSVELDLLEIRLKELLPIVDRFLILEADRTFTGIPKAFVYEENKERFAFAADKILHTTVSLPPLPKGEDPFKLENRMRMQMNSIFTSEGIQTTDWILMSDVDEIPSQHTIALLKQCTSIPSPLHLQLASYLYSFEFPYGNGMDSWRAQVHRYVPGGTTYYRHSRASDDLLVDSGWHCSFCFRSLGDFTFKMTAYSHADRVRSASQLDEARIQKVICEGSDIYGMLPEAYSYRELWTKWGKLDKSASAVNLPKHLIENKDRFAFLLPGGCVRQHT